MHGVAAGCARPGIELARAGRRRRRAAPARGHARPDPEGERRQGRLARARAAYDAGWRSNAQKSLILRPRGPRFRPCRTARSRRHSRAKVLKENGKIMELSLRGCRIGVVGSRLCRPAARRRVRQALRHRRLRHQGGPHRRAQGRQGQHARVLDRPSCKAAQAADVHRRASRTSASCRVFIVTVPTPIDHYNRPDLTPLERSSETVGKVLKKGDVVVYESTVYPGCTEEVCVPILERVSGLKFNKDFFAGYSPERINPGDKEHRLPTIKKVTSGSTPEVAEFVDELYRTHHHGRHAQGLEHPRRRSRQGHREHAARREHRADQRARAASSTASASTPKKCCWPRAPSGTSCRSARAWSAATASAWIRTT